MITTPPLLTNQLPLSPPTKTWPILSQKQTNQRYKQSLQPNKIRNYHVTGLIKRLGPNRSFNEGSLPPTTANGSQTPTLLGKKVKDATEYFKARAQNRGHKKKKPNQPGKNNLFPLSPTPHWPVETLHLPRHNTLPRGYRHIHAEKRYHLATKWNNKPIFPPSNATKTNSNTTITVQKTRSTINIYPYTITLCSAYPQINSIHL